MVAPVVVAALIAAATAAAQGGMSAYGSAQAKKAQSKQNKEDRRKTRSDFLLDSIRQGLESSQSTRGSQNEMTAHRAKSMQSKAAEFRKALLGG